MRNRKFWMVSGLLVSLMVFLSGCTPPTTRKTTEDLANSHGWWDSNVVYWFSLMLDKFAEWFNGEYGLAILLLVIIVRTIILPLMIKQYKSTKAMQKLQPQMKEIREKYKDDTRKQQEEMMKLYQEHQVNPLAGCFPLIIQMPIFIALYRAITVNANVYEHTFLWLQLGKPDKFYILPVIAALTTFVQSKMMQSQQPQQMGAMKGLMLIFPVLIFVMALSFPAALPLYWIYSNIYTITQNYFMYGRKAEPQGKGKEAIADEKGRSNRKVGGGSGKKKPRHSRGK